MKAYADFDVIEVIDGGISYPTLLGIGWANEILAMINFKKSMMTFENGDIRVIDPMDRNEGRRYVELTEEKVVGGWDHVYNISEDYVPFGYIGYSQRTEDQEQPLYTNES